MQCVNCRSINTKVYDSRENNGIRRRKYKCCDCGARFGTLEGYEHDALFRDGSWLKREHLAMVAKQMEEGSAELAALAKLFGKSKGD